MIIYKRDVVIISIFSYLVIISTQPPILESTEISLAGHMVLEHSIFFLLGALSVMLGEIILRNLVFLSLPSSASQNNKNTILDRTSLRSAITSKWKHILSKIFIVNRSGYRYIWIIASVFILAIWHIPLIFDYAEHHIQIHIAQHISFIVVGATGYLAIRSFGESFNLFLLLSLMGLMSFTGLLFSVTQAPLYTVYSVHDHNEAGTYMIIISIMMLLIGFPAYLIHRALFHTQIATKKPE
ncbi:MAG TPA: DUF1404 family protein [Nitrososphaeraceae archaeon]|jgi:hypothetical protein